MNIINWITAWVSGEMGKTDINQMFKPIHLISVAAVMLVLVLFFLIAHSKKISLNKKEKILNGGAIFFLCFECLWRVLYIIFRHSTMTGLWPNYACHLSGILVPIICLADWKTGKKMFYTFALIGAFINFVYPLGVFENTVFVFPNLRNLIQHFGLIFIPMFESVLGRYKPSVKDYPWTLLGLSVHIFNSEVLSRIWGGTGDYLYLRSGIPFTINGIPGWITTLFFALVFIFAFMFLLDVKTSIKCFTHDSN